MRELIATERPLTSGLVAGFTRRLATRTPGRERRPPSSGSGRYLAQRGETIDEAVSQDARNQAADEIAMRNVILSLRGLGGLDWNRFVEEHSAVEQALRSDPAGVYGRMDFATRDYYRHVVERLARGSPLPEEEVARRAVEHARRAEDWSCGKTPAVAASRGGAPACGLLSGRWGPSAAEKRILPAAWRRDAGRPRPPVHRWPATWAAWRRCGCSPSPERRRLLAAGDCRQRRPRSVDAVADLVCRAAGQFAVSLVNWLCTFLVPPRPMARIDFSNGIPPEHRTLVAVPALLTSERTVRDLVEQLELRYLANQDDNLWFALLSDFPDADQETLAGDQRLLELARTEIERLNRRYCADRPGDLLPPASAAEVESATGRMDGRRAKTGQVGGPQPAAANRRGRCF